MAARRAARILAPLLACAVVAGAVEVAVRARLPHYASRDFFLTLFGDPPDATPPEQQPLFEGDPELFWRLRPNVDRAVWDYTMVSTNAQGLRYPASVERKRPGTFRIVCLGDSVTFGYRVPLVFPDTPEQYDRKDTAYPGRLERLLRAEYPDREVEVITLAVPGYSTHQGRLLLEEWIDRLEPDVVVICFGFNDVALKPRPDEVVMASDPVATTLRRVISSSQTLLHLWRWWTSRQRHERVVPRSLEPRVPQRRYLDNVAAMVARAQASGSRVLVVGPVYRDAESNPLEGKCMRYYRASLRDAMLARGIPYVEIDELTERAYPDNKPLFGELAHPSSSGHQLMAERVFEALRGERMLAELDARDAA